MSLTYHQSRSNIELTCAGCRLRGDEVGPCTEFARRASRISGVPLAVLGLPSGNVLLANAAVARVLGVTSETLIGSNYLDLVVTEEQRAAEEAFQALAHGALTGYQAVGSFRMEKGPAQQMALWVFAVEVDGERVVLVSAVPLHGGTTALEPTTTVLNGPPPGHIVLGTIDNEWRIDRVSHDVVEMLGYNPEEVVGLPLLGAIHPREIPSFLAAVEHARIVRRTVQARVRIRGKSSDWVPVTIVLATLTGDFPPALAVALVRSSDVGTVIGATSRTERSRLDMELQRITHDLGVAGVVPRLGRLPDVTRVPALSALTTREWEVLVLLLEGQRVAYIAAELYVSQSTVRNHLSSIFSKLGVHSQAHLIRLLSQD